MKNDSQSTLYRTLIVLSRIPKYPNKTTVTRLLDYLENQGIKISRRVLERDLVAIEEQGYFQIGCDENKPRGWYWLEEAKSVDIPMMESNAALTFLMTAEYLEKILPRSTLKYLSPYHKRAKEVMKNLPGRLSCWPDKIRVVPRGIHLRQSEIDPKVQDVIYDALFRGIKIKVKYRKLGVDSASDYILNPLGLIVRDTSLNLVATISDHDNPLNFLLHRMKSAEITGEPVRVPKGFSLDQHIQTGEMGIKKSEEPIKLKMKLLTSFTKNLFAESPLDKKQKIVTEPDGAIILEAEVPDTVVFRSFLLGFGSQVEVVEPESLRKELLEQAEGMVGRYK